MGDRRGDNWEGEVAFVAFAKNPELVAVKTRLAKSLDEERAMRLYLAFLEDCLASLKSIEGAQHYLACYPDATGHVLSNLAAKYEFRLVGQEGKDLGERMLNCVKTLLANHSAVIVFGTDVPVLPLEGITENLGRMEYWDVLLGPSRDGGYWAFGAKWINERMFEGIQWGSDSVFVETIKNCVKLGLEVAFLEVSEDVDDEQSLRRFCKLLEDGGNDALASRLALAELGLLVSKEC